VITNAFSVDDVPAGAAARKARWARLLERDDNNDGDGIVLELRGVGVGSIITPRG
jgi:hypothetical protein